MLRTNTLYILDFKETLYSEYSTAKNECHDFLFGGWNMGVCVYVCVGRGICVFSVSACVCVCVLAHAHGLCVPEIRAVWTRYLGRPNSARAHTHSRVCLSLSLYLSLTHTPIHASSIDEF